MSFVELRHPWHQPDLMVCVPTVLKVLFQNQFDINLSIRVWKTRTACDQFGVIPYRSIRSLSPWLMETHKIQLFEKTGLTEKELDSLIGNGIIPLIYLPLNYLKRESDPIVDEEGTKWFHGLLVVGVENEQIYLYDPFLKGYPDCLERNQVKALLPVPKFLKLWEFTQRRAYWFNNLPRKDKQLTEFAK